ncbi:proline-rich protein 36-like [Psammomys obesus]|uniref:proline-rich protein 36-like n=1 Tax=Psammomys obesus TaxID=48139 RepID=UPI0024534250|nr:proline-rich protein 36-like [Psammomys obesus]
MNIYIARAWAPPPPGLANRRAAGRGQRVLRAGPPLRKSAASALLCGIGAGAEFGDFGTDRADGVSVRRTVPAELMRLPVQTRPRALPALALEGVGSPATARGGSRPPAAAQGRSERCGPGKAGPAVRLLLRPGGQDGPGVLASPVCELRILLFVRFHARNKWNWRTKVARRRAAGSLPATRALAAGQAGAVSTETASTCGHLCPAGRPGLCALQPAGSALPRGGGTGSPRSPSERRPRSTPHGGAEPKPPALQQPVLGGGREDEPRPLLRRSASVGVRTWTATNLRPPGCPQGRAPQCWAQPPPGPTPATREAAPLHCASASARPARAGRSQLPRRARRARLLRFFLSREMSNTKV